ncbi:hypothetical protein ACMFMF_011175 [Clarireedia jacksonii]
MQSALKIAYCSSDPNTDHSKLSKLWICQFILSRFGLNAKLNIASHQFQDVTSQQSEGYTYHTYPLPGALRNETKDNSQGKRDQGMRATSVGAQPLAVSKAYRDICVGSKCSSTQCLRLKPKHQAIGTTHSRRGSTTHVSLSRRTLFKSPISLNPQ